MKLRILAAGLAAMVLAGPAIAQSTPGANTPVTDKREAIQQKRIDQGTASGQLTPAEAANVNKRESNLQAKEGAAKADGAVTGKERRGLRRTENRDSAAIARKKHNDRAAPAPQ